MSNNTKQQNMIALAYDKRGKLLAVGKNNYNKTHRLQAHYANKTSNPHRIYIHAELDCLIKARKRGTISKIVVMRMGNKGQYLYAKPCDACQLAIKDFGVKHVEHT